MTGLIGSSPRETQICGNTSQQSARRRHPDFRWARPSGITTDQLQQSRCIVPLSIGFIPMEAATRWSIEVIFFESCLRAIESLLPSGQAGRRAFFIRLLDVAGSCRSHWGQPNGNQKPRKDIASICTEASSRFPLGSPQRDHN